MIAVVGGMIATYPVGGMAWDYGQYVLGLESLGFDVYYLEDTGLESYHLAPSAYLQSCIELFSDRLTKRWHYRPPNAEPAGMDQRDLEEVVRDADLFLNVSGGCLLRDAYMLSRCKVLVETDPGLNQFVNFPKWDRSPGWQGTHGYRGHDWFFTYGENIGKPLCSLPDLGLTWHPTRPPVVSRYWKPAPPGSRWTTVMSWNPYRLYGSPIEYEGRTYGAKEMEFERIETLPSLVTAELEVAASGESVPHERWRRNGWHTLDASTVSGDANSYRDYIQSSRGEFSVAKNVYVDTNCGWFSTRSVCYLASGRPVVVQDTGFSENIPTGEGLLTWKNLEEARQALQLVEDDYSFHQRRAREMVADHFEAKRVIGEMLEVIGL